MKDWKAEYDKIRGELAESRRQLEWYKTEFARNNERDREVRDKFKELLLDVLGR